MNRRGRPALLALAAGIASVLGAPVTSAQEAAVPVAGATPYVDRVIGAGNLQPLPPDEDDTSTDDTGLPRSYRIELDLSRTQRGPDTFDEYGVSGSGFRDTSTLGSFSLDANLFHSQPDLLQPGLPGRGSGWAGSATLWQRNLYLDGGWRADNGLGVLNTPSLPLQRNQYRFFLPTTPFAGIASEWVNDTAGLRLQGSYGRGGVYTGGRVAGFDLGSGAVASLGAQWTWAPQWTGAASFLGTQGRIAPDNLGTAQFEQAKTRAVYAATAWDGALDHWQVNLLSSSGDRGNASGAWLDGSGLRGRYLHRYGVFRLDPGLSWGALPINNDAEGAYYRLAYQFARWSWNVGIDQIKSVSGQSFDGTYANAFARYQYSSTLGYGGSVSVRRSPSADTAYSTQVFADRSSGWGQTRVQVDQAHAGTHDVGTQNDSWLLSVDQAFPLRAGARLSTSITYGRAQRDGEASTRTSSLALIGSRDFSNRLSVQGTARWLRDEGPSAVHGLDLNLGLDWRLGRGWTLAANLYQNQGSQRSPFALDPLATDTPFISLPRERSAFLTLRYDHHAGQPQAVLGGVPGGAVGSITGTIFLDDNDDGVRAASEQVVPNLTVVLDGRYSVHTDVHGNFEFPRVAPGAHTITVIPDNLPLPWSIADTAAQRTVQVGVRQQVRLDIGARRPR